MKTLVKLTTGASYGVGSGTWTATLSTTDHFGHVTSKTFTGTVENSNTYLLELQAVVEGLRKLTRPCTVHVFSANETIVFGATKYLPNWIRRGWKTVDKKPVAGTELWQQILTLQETHTVSFHRLYTTKAAQAVEQQVAKATTSAQILDVFKSTMDGPGVVNYRGTFSSMNKAQAAVEQLFAQYPPQGYMTTLRKCEPVTDGVAVEMWRFSSCD